MADEFRNRDWIELVKRTREQFGVSIEEAHDLIFADDEIRRLVAGRINRVPECRKMVAQDIKRQGANSRFAKEGDRFRFRQNDGQRP